MDLEDLVDPHRLELAGLGPGRLYPGSWAQWCADPARPVASGESD